MNLLIERYPSSEHETIGNGFVLDNDFINFEFKTLELAWKNNQKQISCVPIGDYKVKKRWSKKFGNHFHILDVPNRSYILIHCANFYTQLRGCVAVGDDLSYINGDNEIDVVNSTKTLKELLKMMPNDFNLKIVNV
jgi:hypothetical protein